MNVAPPLASAYLSSEEDSWGFATSCWQLVDSADVKEAVHDSEPREDLIEKGVESMHQVREEEEGNGQRNLCRGDWDKALVLALDLGVLGPAEWVVAYPH